MGLPKSKAQIAWRRYWVVCLLGGGWFFVCLRRWAFLDLFACSALIVCASGFGAFP
jgi:hypothetical protein